MHRVFRVLQDSVAPSTPAGGGGGGLERTNTDISHATRASMGAHSVYDRWACGAGWQAAVERQGSHRSKVNMWGNGCSQGARTEVHHRGGQGQ